MKKNSGFLKKTLPVIILSIFYSLNATIDDTQGFYRAGDPTFPYLNNESSYYYNPSQDLSWDGQGWMFQTGYEIPANRCYECKEKNYRYCNHNKKGCR